MSFVAASVALQPISMSKHCSLQSVNDILSHRRIDRQFNWLLTGTSMICQFHVTRDVTVSFFHASHGSCVKPLCGGITLLTLTLTFNSVSLNNLNSFPFTVANSKLVILPAFCFQSAMSLNSMIFSVSSTSIQFKRFVSPMSFVRVNKRVSNGSAHIYGGKQS